MTDEEWEIFTESIVEWNHQMEEVADTLIVAFMDWWRESEQKFKQIGEQLEQINHRNIRRNRPDDSGRRLVDAPRNRPPTPNSPRHR